ncbi:hypothetical protein [Pararhizobium qamdonense]|uniref:hypothetical protein n=1 Tax=Pararhizobium qamdonense TaxID=3031126 RepID=UPI0023E2B1F7|nr:hypothetical protein [Pararhizobium qamdonense]
MAILRTMQPAFTAGELSPALWARVDLAKYQSGLKTAKNVFVHPHGGISNRAGLEFIGRTKNAATAVLIPFVYDAETNQTYNLEFTNLRLRIYRAGAPILQAAKAVTAISGAGVLTSAAHGYANGDEVFFNGAIGPTLLNARNFVVRNVTTNTFTLEDLYGVAVSTAGLPAYAGGAVTRRLYEVASPYPEAVLTKLVFAQENDVMYITHQKYAPRKLSRLADDDWTITVPTFAPLVSIPTGLDGTAFYKRRSGNSSAISYRVTAVSASGAESAASSTVSVTVQTENEDGRRVRLGWPAVTGAVTYRIYRSDDAIGLLADTPNTSIELEQTQYVGDGTAVPTSSAPGAPPVPTGVNGLIVFGKPFRYKVSAISDESGEESLPSAAFVLRNDMSFAGNRNVLVWNAVSGAGSYAVYRLDNGRYGYIGTTEETTFTDENITPDLASGPQQADNPFAGTGNYPACVNFFEQRLAMGGTEKVPSGVWLGQSSNYENFGSASPVRASDAITFRIRSREKNAVRALIETRGLGVFSSAGEFTVSGGGEDFLTPANVNVKKQGNRGSSALQPISVGDVMLFARARGGVVQDFSYEFANDAFVGRDLTVMARHLFEGRKIISWAYSQSPHSIIWAILDSGLCVSLTYMREHDVWAWTRHETDGVFEAVNVVPEDDEDAVYFVVRRSVNGTTQRYIERMHSRRFEDSKDCFFVDSGLSYEGAPLKTIQGLFHLEGQQIVALADGNVVRGLTVTNGQVTLPNAASVVHAGKSYEALIKTLDLDLGVVQGLGTTQSRLKSVANVTLRVEKTRGIWVGPKENKLNELKQRQYENWNEAIRLATDDVEITPTPDWTRGATIYIKQFDPLPMTILAILPDVRVGS